MFDTLIHASLRHRLAVMAAAVAVLLYGALAITRMPLDVFPDLNRPTVTLLTESGGLSPEEVELSVTRPIELAMAGTPGVERVRSQSAPGLSVVWVELGWSEDIWRARQQVAERVATLDGSLPPGITPHLGPVTSIMGEILLVGLHAPDGAIAPPALRRLADITLRPRLLAIPGVAQVITIGGGVEQLEVAVDADALATRGLPLSSVIDAASEAQASASGGFLDHHEQEVLVRVDGRSLDPEALGDTPIPGTSLRLSDVADVTTGTRPMRGSAGVMGQPGVVLSIQKQPGADTLTLDAQVNAALAELTPALPPGVVVTPLFRQATFIEAAVDNVRDALRDGAILVVVVLVIFLASARTTAITLTAIPLSFLTATIVLEALGQTVNTMTLGGLAVAIGELVDDAIVDVENVWRRLRENAALDTPRPSLEVVAEASQEIRGSVVFSTALVILVFVPLLALGGVEGRLFVPLGVAYITAIAASLVVSLTVTPVLCSLLLPGAATQAAPHGDSRFVRALKAADERLLRRVLHDPRPALALAAGLAVAAAVSIPWLPRAFLPPFFEGTATVNLFAQPGTSLAASDSLGRLAELRTLQVPEVVTVGRRTGRAELDEHAEGVHYTELEVELRPSDRDREVVLTDLRDRLGELTGLSVTVGQPIRHRLDHVLSGVRAEIAVKLFGPDLAVLRAEAERVAAAIADIPGLVDLTVERQVLVPQLVIRPDRDALRRFGLPVGALTDTLAAALGGATVDALPDGVRTLDLVVRLQPDQRDDPHHIAELPIVLPDGRAVRLDQLATVTRVTSPNTIAHENGQRRVILGANTSGAEPTEVTAAIAERIETIGLAPGVRVVLDGHAAQQADGARRIAVLALVALAGMYAVLHIHLGRHRMVGQVLINVPLALVGAVAALWWTGQALSVATMVGFVTVVGIASRNSILLLSHYEHLRTVEGVPFGEALVLRGSLERLVPVAMTALCAGLSLLPLALGAGEPGREILTPVAQVILGGLCSATLLDLLVTPPLYLRYGNPVSETP